MNHNIPISATFTLFNYLQVNPSVNYTERWYTRKINQHYNEDTTGWNHCRAILFNGFYRVSNYSASLALSTKLYGMYKPIFAKKKEIQIRHVFTPQVSLSGAPDLASTGKNIPIIMVIHNIILLYQSALWRAFS